MQDEASGVPAELEAWRLGRMTAVAMGLGWAVLSALTLASFGWALAVVLLVIAPGIALIACCAVEQGAAMRRPCTAERMKERP